MRYLIIALFLFSCSPERQLARLVAKHPELAKTDTVWKTITIITPITHVDTVFTSVLTKDTIVITKENLKIKYYNNGKTVYLSGICDTLAIQAKVPVSVTVVNPVKEIHVIRWWDWIIYGIASISVLLLAFFVKSK